jgi:phenylpropionate dioxygenase-like ring-hydroxylating dioxygenase large terminal subunit
MLTAEENELVTRTGPGTPMGEVMRRYWMPAALSSELAEPDGAPVRVKLLGERLVAFRDSSGKVGLVDEFCAHRRASLFLGRNEENGIRCVYHGWKYDVNGTCLETPTEPAGSNFKDKIRIKSYPALEMGGLVWAYLGPKEKTPPPPKFEFTQVPETHRYVTKTWEECNWLQALEGAIDSQHASYLHRALTSDKVRSRYGQSASGYRARSTTPSHDADVTDYGVMFASVRPLGDEGDYVRIYHFVMPFYSLRAAQQGIGGEVKRPIVAGHMWVPMDDENCMVYDWLYSFGEAPIDVKWRDEFEWGSGRGPEDRTLDFRKTKNRTNNWLIDRKAQKTLGFSGIEGINTQDHAVQESMGPIVDRTQEHLGTSDKAIIAVRRLLIKAARSIGDGIDPPGTGSEYYSLRAIDKIVPSESDWKQSLQGEIHAAPSRT